MTVSDLEIVKRPDLSDWKKSVLERDGNACVNCENTAHIAAAFIVPPEVGGRLRASNGVTICRDCRMLAEGSRVLPIKIDNKTPINFFISRQLHESVSAYAEKSNFGSLSALIRHMILAYIQAPEQFEDLHLYQDHGGADTKINSWVDGTHYELFKRLCADNNLSYTNAFKGLLMVALDGNNGVH